MEKKFGITFGALGGTIASQLKKQKLKFDAKECARFEIMRTSITHLMFGRILTESEKNKAFKKLFIQINDHVNKLN